LARDLVHRSGLFDATAVPVNVMPQRPRVQSAAREYYYRHTLATKTELVAVVEKWMHCYRNQRRHSVIGMLSPVAYEQSLSRPRKPHNPCPLFGENLTEQVRAQANSR
jgi:transposase InsO family protein